MRRPYRHYAKELSECVGLLLLCLAIYCLFPPAAIAFLGLIFIYYGN